MKLRKSSLLLTKNDVTKYWTTYRRRARSGPYSRPNTTPTTNTMKTTQAVYWICYMIYCHKPYSCRHQIFFVNCVRPWTSHSRGMSMSYLLSFISRLVENTVVILQRNYYLYVIVLKCGVQKHGYKYILLVKVTNKNILVTCTAHFNTITYQYALLIWIRYIMYFYNEFSWW